MKMCVMNDLRQCLKVFLKIAVVKAILSKTSHCLRLKQDCWVSCHPLPLNQIVFTTDDSLEFPEFAKQLLYRKALESYSIMLLSTLQVLL